jgi:hypothetical protein
MDGGNASAPLPFLDSLRKSATFSADGSPNAGWLRWLGSCSSRGTVVCDLPVRVSSGASQSALGKTRSQSAAVSRRMVGASITMSPGGSDTYQV